MTISNSVIDVSIPIVSTSTISTPQFSTSSYNNLLMKTIVIYPSGSVGGTYNNGFWLIDVYDYLVQTGFAYLFLNLQAKGGLCYWQGRVVIANSSSMSVYPDFYYLTRLDLTNTGRTVIMVQSPNGTNNGLNELYVKIMG